MQWILCEWKVVFYIGDMIFHLKKINIKQDYLFTISNKKDVDFIGKQALEKIKKEKIKSRFAMFTLKDSKPGEPLLLHDEPIYLDDKIIGRSTSGNYSFNFKKNLTFGYINNDFSNEELQNKNLFIEVEKKKYPISNNQQTFKTNKL